MELQDGVSILIACYNGGNRLDKTLDYLYNNLKNININNQVIIIDNNSSDNTYYNAINICNMLKFKDYIVEKEPKPGKDNAIKLGYSLCKYKYVAIVDDDNWLINNFIETAYEFMRSHKKCAVVGGYGIPIFETSPPEWGKNGFACGPQGIGIENISNKQGWVYGAGSVYNLEILNRLYESGFKHCLGTQRYGKVDVSGEDVELCYSLRLIGYEIWYNENLKFYHFMPAGRIIESRLLSLKRGDGIQAFTLDMYAKCLISPNSKINRIWFYKYLIKFTYESVISLKGIITNKNKFQRKSNFQTVKYRLKTLLNFNYCNNKYKYFKSNIDIINKIKFQ